MTKIGDNQHAAEIARLARLAAGLLDENARKKTRIQNSIKTVDTIVGFAAAFVFLVEPYGASNASLNTQFNKWLAVAAGLLLVANVAYYTFFARGDAERQKDHADDLRFHASQIHDELHAQSLFRSSEHLDMPVKATKNALKRATDRWPILLKDFIDVE